MVKIMNYDNPNQWIKFWNALGTELGDPDDNKCKHNHINAIKVLKETFGYNDEEVSKSIEFFNSMGGHCDCEIMFNMCPDFKNK